MPLTARALGSASTSIITTQLFSLRYPLKTHHGLSARTKGGIATGVIIGVLIFGGVAFYFIRRRRSAKRDLDDRSTVAPSFVGPMDQFNRRSGAFSDGGTYIPPASYGWHPSEQPISELPSPTAAEPRTPLPQSELWFPPQEKKEEPPMELPGDTHLNQHHPAYSSGAGTMDSAGVPRPASGGVPGTPTDVVSPLDAPTPLGVAK